MDSKNMTMQKDNQIKQILAFFYLKSRFSKNSIIYDYYSGRPMREVSRLVNLSRYKMDSIIYDLKLLGWVRRKGGHLEFKSLRSIQWGSNRQLVKYLIKYNYRYNKNEFADYINYGYALILKLGLSNQYYWKQLGKYNTQKRVKIIDALIRKADPDNYDIYNSIRSIAKLWQISRNTAHRKLKKLAFNGIIKIKHRNLYVDRIPSGTWGSYLSVYTGKGHIYYVKNGNMLNVYEHKGMIIEFR